jgi:hypothetical protein
MLETFSSADGSSLERRFSAARASGAISGAISPRLRGRLATASLFSIPLLQVGSTRFLILPDPGAPYATRPPFATAF